MQKSQNYNYNRAYFSSFLLAIIAHNHLPFCRIFSNFVHFCPNFQIFCPFSTFTLLFFWKKKCTHALVLKNRPWASIIYQSKKINIYGNRAMKLPLSSHPFIKQYQQNLLLRNSAEIDSKGQTNRTYETKWK